jgi:hypothetical protein
MYPWIPWELFAISLEQSEHIFRTAGECRLIEMREFLNYSKAKCLNCTICSVKKMTKISTYAS